MNIDETIFVKLMLGAFGLVIVGFTTRGLTTVVVGSETAQMVAAPIFILAVLVATFAFVMAVMIKLGIVRTTDGEEASV